MNIIKLNKPIYSAQCLEEGFILGHDKSYTVLSGSGEVNHFEGKLSFSYLANYESCMKVGELYINEKGNTTSNYEQAFNFPYNSRFKYEHETVQPSIVSQLFGLKDNEIGLALRNTENKQAIFLSLPEILSPKLINSIKRMWVIFSKDLLTILIYQYAEKHIVILDNPLI